MACTYVELLLVHMWNCLLLVIGPCSSFFPLFIQDGRYLPYVLNECVWMTPHNNNHGYIREITAIGITGK